MNAPRSLRQQLVLGGVKDSRVLDAMDRVARERFVPPELVPHAYDDGALPIGFDQTISQPYIVAAMTEAVAPRAEHHALDIGTGSGYQAAVLAELTAEVHSVERIPELSQRASAVLRDLGYDNVHCHVGDGSLGWIEGAPYDVIIVACAATRVPDALREQLRVGGRLCLPVGETVANQQLRLITRRSGTEYEDESLAYVRFVPMIEGDRGA